MSVTAQDSPARLDFHFRNHAVYATPTYPRFVGDWNRLSDSGSVQRWLSGMEDSEVVLGANTIAIPAGVIVLVDRLADGWRVSVPRIDAYVEIAIDADDAKDAE